MENQSKKGVGRMTKKENENKNRYKKLGKNLGFQFKMYLLFSVAIIVLCAIIFTCNYDIAYDKDAGAGYFSPSDAVIFKYVMVSLAAVISSIVLKIVCKRRVAILFLLVLSIVLPILCYHFNYWHFKEYSLEPYVIEAYTVSFEYPAL